MININLEFNQIKLIFAQAETSIMNKENIYYLQRQMLKNIFNQIPENNKRDIIYNCPSLTKQLEFK